MMISKVHLYSDTNEDLWCGLTSGVFLPKASREEPIFVETGTPEWWIENPFPTLDDLLCEWERCGGVIGTDKVDMTEDSMTSMTGFLEALEVHLTDTAEAVEELCSPVHVQLSQFEDLLNDIRIVVSSEE